MDENANKIMAASADKNMIDKDEYPASAAIGSALRNDDGDSVERSQSNDDDRGFNDRIQ